MKKMTERQAVNYLDGLVGMRGRRRDLRKLNAFAAQHAIPFETVYAWWRKGAVPHWRLHLFVVRGKS